MIANSKIKVYDYGKLTLRNNATLKQHSKGDLNIATRLKSFGLNEREVRLCVLVMIDDFSGKEIAQNINYAESGIRSLKSKTAKKIGTDSKNLRKTLLKIAIIPD